MSWLNTVLRAWQTWPHLMLGEPCTVGPLGASSYRWDPGLRRLSEVFKVTEVLGAEPGLEGSLTPEPEEAWKARNTAEAPPQNVKEERGGDTLGETLWIRNKSARALRVLCAGPAAEVVARALGLGPCFRATAPLFRALTPRLSHGWCRRGVSPSHRAQTHHILLTQNLFCAKTAELWKGAESMCYV